LPSLRSQFDTGQNLIMYYVLVLETTVITPRKRYVGFAAQVTGTGTKFRLEPERILSCD